MHVHYLFSITSEHIFLFYHFFQTHWAADTVRVGDNIFTLNLRVDTYSLITLITADRPHFPVGGLVSVLMNLINLARCPVKDITVNFLITTASL